MWRAFAIAFLSLGQASGEAIRLEAAIQDESYCQQEDGRLVLRLTLMPVYRNTTEMTVIVPRVSYLRAVSLTAGEKVVWRTTSSKRNDEVLASSIWQSPQPSPSLFFQLKPGEKGPGVMKTIIIPLQPSGSSARGVKSGEYMLVFSLDHGPYSEQRIDGLPWKDSGTLTTGILDSRPSLLRVLLPSRLQQCKGPPTLRLGRD
jgi:hypothetical protein